MTTQLQLINIIIIIKHNSVHWMALMFRSRRNHSQAIHTKLLKLVTCTVFALYFGQICISTVFETQVYELYINNCPTKCNTKQSIYYSASSLYMFGRQPRPSWVHKTVTTASGTVQLPPSNVANLATLEGGSCTKNMRSTGGCSYSFVYSWCMGVVDTRNMYSERAE